MEHVAVGLCLALAVAAVGCSGGGDTTPTTASSVAAPDTTASPPETTPAPETTVAPAAGLDAGAASRSLLPTVGGGRDYLADAPGWGTADPASVDPLTPGVFVPAFDQGRVDVGNGESDAAWVHDDLRVTALALRTGSDLVVLVTADLYMIFAADGDEIIRRARAALPPDVAETARIVISANHNHHGPDSAFGINDDWYSMFADEAAAAVVDAVAALEPATLVAGVEDHRFGQSDQRDPIIVDPRLNVLGVRRADGSSIATVVQWTDHPETTLGWNPPGDISAECAQKGWGPDDCSAEGRYFSADYPGVLREHLQASVGGEVLYLNGPLGNQIGPGRADVWLVDEEHPVGDGVTAPEGASPVAGAADLRDRNQARTHAIGTQLALHVESILASAAPLAVEAVEYGRVDFFTRLTNIGFRVLLADGDLGWQVPDAFTCGVKPFTEQSCTSDGGALVDDPVLTPLIESQVREGDVLRTRVQWVRLGDVGFLFLPGELPPELVVGLPDDFTTATDSYFEFPDLHATGSDYVVPGALLDLVPTAQTFTVGLGGDELGYWVPLSEYRLKCLDLVIPADLGYTCQKLFDEGRLVTPDAVAGTVCSDLWENAPESPTPSDLAVIATCRYGQALGRELGEPEDHYEETNAAGWDLVDDLWAATEELFGVG